MPLASIPACACIDSTRETEVIKDRPSDNSVKVRVSRLTASGWQPASGIVGLYPPDDCRVGDLLEASGVLREPPPQVNPGGFSARLYWLRRGAGLVLHPHANGVHWVGRHPPDAAQSRLRAIRTRLLEVNRRTLSPTTALIVNDFLVGDTGNPDRGPLLIISGEKDHTVPWAIANASYRQQKDNPNPTEIVEIENRGHSLTIDSGWRQVAETALSFVQRERPS